MADVPPSFSVRPSGPTLRAGGSAYSDVSSDARGVLVSHPVAYVDTAAPVRGSDKLRVEPPRSSMRAAGDGPHEGTVGAPAHDASVQQRQCKLLSADAAKVVVHRAIDAARARADGGRGDSGKRVKDSRRRLSVPFVTSALTWELQRKFYPHFALVVPPAP